MSTKETSLLPLLREKPLVEAIFELRWSLSGSSDGPTQHDPGFQLLVGRYYERVKHVYPTVRELPAAQLPEDMTAYMVRHQFRSKPDGWPVTQLGPGVLTVNETSGYEWESFRSLVTDASRALFESYPTELAALQISGAQLRYQNAIEYNPVNSPPRDFLRSMLHTNLALDNDLFRSPGGVSEPDDVHLNLFFPLTGLPGKAGLLISTGMRDGVPAIILDLSVRSIGVAAPADVNALGEWLTKAHEIIEHWFVTLCQGPLLKKFEGGA